MSLPNSNTSQALTQADLSILRCPRCVVGAISNSERGLECDHCREQYPVEYGIPVLLRDPGARTQLEDIDYDDLHQINMDTAQAMFKTWKNVLDKFDVNYSSALEIGSGTGYLSYGMLKHKAFGRYIPTDISVRFLRDLRARTAGLSVQPLLYAADANHLPFSDDTFDAVLGNSVLHHFLDYPSTLAQTFRLLRKGGIAVFFEPIATGNGYIGMLVKMMLSIESEFQMKVFTRQERKKMSSLVAHPLILKRNKAKRNWLKTIEDKYVFDTIQLAQLAREIGFREFRALNPNEALIRSYAPYLKRKLTAIHKIPIDKINRFNFLFECFSTTIGELAPESLDAPMQFLVLRK